MFEIPVLRIELNHIKRSVEAAMINSSGDLNAIIQKTLDDTLTEEWIQQKINEEVKKMLVRSIERISNDYELQRAISDLISRQIATMIDAAKT